MLRTIALMTGMVLVPTMPVPAAAQAPAVLDSVRAPAPAPTRLWRLELDMAMNSSSGNNQLTVVTSDAKISRTIPTVVAVTFDGRAEYGRSGGEQVARDLKASLQFDFRPAGHWTPALFVTGEQDPFKRLNVRLNAGVGGTYVLSREGPTQMSVSAAALYNYEELLPAPDSTRISTQQNARWKCLLQGTQRLTDDMQVSEKTSYEPVWDYAGNYLLETNTALRMRVTENLALSITHVFQRDSTPPSDVLADDQSVKMGVNFTTNW
ncbi:MAG TPA: DUF481 domain-containing protein [Longimicrobiales bacterium]|nr:DUF481 domain-containing protein [Longimicrobiales bacterium]